MTVKLTNGGKPVVLAVSGLLLYFGVCHIATEIRRASVAKSKAKAWTSYYEKGDCGSCPPRFDGYNFSRSFTECGDLKGISVGPAEKEEGEDNEQNNS